MTGRCRPDVGVAQRMRDRAIPTGALAEHAAAAATATSEALLDCRQHFLQQEVLPGTHRSRVDVLVAAEPGEAIGKATTTGGMRCSPISRSSRSGRFSRKPSQFVWDRPLLVKPTRSTSKGNPCPACPAGTYTSTTRTGGSPSMLLLRAWLSIVTRLTEPIDPKNLRMH